MLARQFGPLAEIKEAEKRIEFASGGFLEVKSAHTDASLRSATLDFVIIDEAAFVPKKRWTSELRATLAVRRGWALFLSTFDGENWFFDIYERGMSEEFPEWQSWRHPSIDNPYIDVEEVEEARRELPQAEFEQEYEANPLVYVGAVFPGKDLVRAAERGNTLTGWRSDLSTYAGLDWGYTNETALEVCQEDVEGRVFWIEEHTWTATELNERCRQIVDVCRRLNIEGIWADAAGADENATLALAIRNAGLRTMVQGVPFGAPLKRTRGAKKSTFKDAAISTRRYYLERDLESISPNCPKLIRDSKRYRYKEGTDEILKKDDHTVDALTAFYASRRATRTAIEQGE